MKMKNNLEIIRAKVIEAVPEIMELKFGCVVKRALTEGGGTLATVLGVEESGQIAYTSWAPFHKNKTSIHHDFVKHLEILGRPIRLTDVLVAIGNMLVIVDAGGNFYRMSMKLSDKLPKLSEHLGKWNLREDDLSKQSPETLRFLAELLN